jgi:peptidoglycan/LPS O-acetylase OafA/YrhL
MARVVRRQAGQVDEVRESEQVFDLNRALALIAGLGFLLLGALVLLDTKFQGFPDQPLASVAGFTQTPLLGVIDLVFGLLLLAGAGSRDRGVSTFTGGLMLVGGVIVAIRTTQMPKALIANAGYGWMVAIVGVVMLVVALVMPRTVARQRVVRSDQVDRPV